MIVPATFCDRWHDYGARPAADRRAYVAEELRRLDASGAPVLSTVLSCTYQSAQTLALEIARTGVTLEGVRVLEYPRWQLRLAEGAVPPDRDPQGRPVPPDRKGKVLLAKVGLVGAVPESVAQGDPTAARIGSGRERRAREMSGRDLYHLVEVTREAREYSLRDAVLILRQWGRGVQTEMARAIVEELPQRAAQPSKTPKG